MVKSAISHLCGYSFKSYSASFGNNFVYSALCICNLNQRPLQGVQLLQNALFSDLLIDFTQYSTNFDVEIHKYFNARE